MSAPRVVLLHGLGADGRAFQRFERLLPESWHVTALDLLGHGAADKPATGYTLDDHAAYVARELGQLYDEDIADDPPVLVGHSYGGATAVATAALYPHLLRGIVLLDPVVYHDDPKMESATERMMQARREGRMTETVNEIFADQSPALRGWIIETWQAMSVGVIDEIDHDWMRFARQVTLPVTIVHGDADRGSGGSEPVARFNDPTVVHVPGAGHYVHATHARETAAAVVDAVERLTARA